MENNSKKTEVDENALDKHMRNIKLMAKREANNKVVPFWDYPMELLKVLMRAQTVYKRCRWAIEHQTRFSTPALFWKFFRVLLVAQNTSSVPPNHVAMSQAFVIHKKIIPHETPNEIGKYIRRMFAFGAITIVLIKDAARRIQVHKVENFEYGCVPQRRREKAIIIQEVLAERMRMPQVNNCTKVWDAITHTHIEAPTGTDAQ